MGFSGARSVSFLGARFVSFSWRLLFVVGGFDLVGVSRGFGEV